MSSAQRGAELDLMLLRGGRRWGFEFKCTDAPRTAKSMRLVTKDLGIEHLWVAEHLEERGHPLHFVENHQSFAVAQQPVRGRGQSLPLSGHLQVEDLRPPPPLGHDLAGQGRLANLPGPEQGHDGGFATSRTRFPCTCREAPSGRRRDRRRFSRCPAERQAR